KIRSTKLETRNKPKIRKPQTPKPGRAGWGIGIWVFLFVSGFELRISDFHSLASAAEADVSRVAVHLTLAAAAGPVADPVLVAAHERAAALHAPGNARLA